MEFKTKKKEEAHTDQAPEFIVVIEMPSVHHVVTDLILADLAGHLLPNFGLLHVLPLDLQPNHLPDGQVILLWQAQRCPDLQDSFLDLPMGVESWYIHIKWEHKQNKKNDLQGRVPEKRKNL